MPSQFEVHRAKDCAIFKFPLGISAEADEIIKVAAIEANTIYFIVSLQLFGTGRIRPLADSKQPTMLAPLFAGLFLSHRLLGLQHVGLAAISLGHIHKTLGDFRV